jgi:hypothetical protein
MIKDLMIPRDGKEPPKGATPTRTGAYPRFWHLFGPPPLRSGLGFDRKQ